MDETRALNKRYETIAWGVFFIWWGVTTFFRLPDGVGMFGIGLILLGLNAARYFNGMRTSGYTITLGILALVLGAADILRALNVVTADVPTLAVLLIVVGVVWLFRGVNESKRINE
jgi:hypothetical protein